MGLEIPTPAQVGIVGTAGVDTMTDGIITSGMLEEMVFYGLTFGAWTKLFLTLSVIVIILMNIPKAIMAWRKLRRGLKRSRNGKP